MPGGTANQERWSEARSLLAQRTEGPVVSILQGGGRRGASAPRHDCTLVSARAVMNTRATETTVGDRLEIKKVWPCRRRRGSNGRRVVLLDHHQLDGISGSRQKSQGCEAGSCRRRELAVHSGIGFSRVSTTQKIEDTPGFSQAQTRSTRRGQTNAAAVVESRPQERWLFYWQGCDTLRVQRARFSAAHRTSRRSAGRKRTANRRTSDPECCTWL